MEHRYNRGAPKPIPEAPRARRSSSSVATAGKSIVTVLQYLVSAASLLVPSSYPYYEVVCEGIHSLSQLLPYLTRLALSSSDEVIQRSSRLEAVLRAVTRSVGFVEVFAERLASTACNDPLYAATIFFIELLKSACRVAILVDRRRASMLVMWGNSERVDGNSDMANYREWYRIISVQERARSGLAPQSLPPASPPAARKEQEAGSYCGRRSGLLLPLSRLPSSPSKEPASPGSPPPPARVLSPEHLLAIGELLYVARPAVHAWVLHHLSVGRPEVAAQAPAAERSLAPRPRGQGHALALGLSLVMELLSIQLSSEALRVARQEAGAGPARGSSLHSFDRELRRRRAALLFYLIRSPLFDRATLPALKTLLGVFLRVPLLSAVPRYALNVLAYLNDCHFYNSNSS